MFLHGPDFLNKLQVILVLNDVFLNVCVTIRIMHSFEIEPCLKHLSKEECDLYIDQKNQ